MSHGPAETRRGEKIGWTVGWLGGFLWLLILSGVWLADGRVGVAVFGVVLFVGAVGCIVFLAPWHHPRTAYWKLMLPIYLLFFVAVAMTVAVMGRRTLGLSWWSVLWLLPILLPFATIGSKRWNVR